MGKSSSPCARVPPWRKVRGPSRKHPAPPLVPPTAEQLLRLKRDQTECATKRDKAECARVWTPWERIKAQRRMPHRPTVRPAAKQVRQKLPEHAPLPLVLTARKGRPWANIDSQWRKAQSEERMAALEQKVLQAIRRICPQHPFFTNFNNFMFTMRRCENIRRTVLQSSPDRNMQRNLEPYEVTSCMNILLEKFKREVATPIQLKKNKSQLWSIRSAWLRRTCGSKQAAVAIFEVGLLHARISGQQSLQEVASLLLLQLNRISENVEKKKGST